MRKLCKYIFAFILFVSSFADLCYSAKKRLGNSKRAATTGRGNTKRAATTSTRNTKRAATTGTGNTRRAASNRRQVSGRKSIRNAGVGGTSGVASSKIKDSKNNCPIGVVIKKMTDDDGNDVFYKSKTETCTTPSNTTGTTNLYSSKIEENLKRPSWVAGKYAWVFNCNTGYVPQVKNGMNICIEESTLCPLGQTLEKTAKGYINPSTNEICDIPSFAMAKKLSSEENDRSDIPADVAYEIMCNKNYYTDYSLNVCYACPEENPYTKKSATFFTHTEGTVGLDKCVNIYDIDFRNTFTKLTDNLLSVINNKLATLKNDSDDYKKLEALKAKVVSFKTEVYNVISIENSEWFAENNKEFIANWGIMLQNTNTSITDLENVYETMYENFQNNNRTAYLSTIHSMGEAVRPQKNKNK